MFTPEKLELLVWILKWFVWTLPAVMVLVAWILPDKPVEPRGFEVVAASSAQIPRF